VAHDRLTLADYRALADFRYELRRFLQFSEQAARAAGLEPQQHQLLLALRGMPAGVKPTIRVLSERVQTRHHSTVELINRMEARGLVRRDRGEKDRRQVFVRLTPRGDALLRLLSQFHRAELRAVTPRLVRALGVLMREVGDADAAAQA